MIVKILDGKEAIEGSLTKAEVKEAYKKAKDGINAIVPNLLP